MQSEETLHLADVLGVLRRRLPEILAVLVLGLAATLLFLFLVPKKYTAAATLKFDPRQFQISREQTNTQPVSIDRLIAGEITVLRSAPVVGRVIAKLELADDREIIDGALSALLPDFLDDNKGATGSEAKQRLATRRLIEKLSVFMPDKSNIIELEFTSKDPEKAARIVNGVLDSYLRQIQERRLEGAAHTSGWLKERIGRLRGKWQEAERSVEQFKADNKLNFVSGKRLQEERIAKLSDEVVLAGTKSEAARAHYDEAKRLFDAGKFDLLTTVVKSQVLTGLRARLAAASQREASLGATLMAGHPGLIRARAGKSVMQREVAAEARRVLDNLASDAKAASDSERSIRTNLERAIEQIRASRQALVKLHDLQRTAESERAIYEAFLTRSKQSSEDATGQLANFAVVARAVAPAKPSFPAKIKLLLLSTLGFLAAGLGYAFLREMFYDKFRNRQQIEDHLQLPLMSVLPNASTGLFSGREVRRRPDRIVLRRPESAFAQAIAALQIDLRLASRHEPQKVIAITSAEAGEGKTLVASSLAQQAAISGEKVLLIDCNFINRDCSQTFSSGSGNAKETQAINGAEIIRDEPTGLDVLPLPAKLDNSVEFVASKTFADLLASARKTYDWIFIDTTALLTTPATWVLVGDVDATVLVVSWDETNRDMARRAVQKLAVCRANAVGVVLNRANIREMTRYKEYAPGGMLEMPGERSNRRPNLISSSASRARPAASGQKMWMTN